jgi:hypothetical protein
VPDEGGGSVVGVVAVGQRAELDAAAVGEVPDGQFELRRPGGRDVPMRPLWR